MESTNLICGGTKFKYSNGYIGLPVEVDSIPDTVFIEGETLQKKSSIHVSLLCVKDILAIKDISEQEILEAFCTFTTNNDISFFRYTGEFRFAQHEERKTLIALCEVSNLESLFKFLNARLGTAIATQPTHMTLYTLQPNVGIGLNTPADMETKSISVEPPATLKGVLGIGQE